MPTAFVAGATGYTGREVVRALVARGVRTVAHVRPDSSRLTEITRALERDRAEVDTTPWEDVGMTATLTRVHPDYVFALLGTTRARARTAAERGGPEESYDRVDYGLTALLVRAAVNSGGKPRFVYLSALGAGKPSRNPYYAARYKAETELVASGLPFVIARPSFITGPDREEARPAERAAAKVVDGAFGLLRHVGLGALEDRYGSLTARELAAALVALALDEQEPACIAEAERLRALGHRSASAHPAS
jgi:uncharacterized protein YbjT (DUF2867 family)